MYNTLMKAENKKNNKIKEKGIKSKKSCVRIASKRTT